MKIRVVRSEFGYARLSDGTTISIRAIVLDVNEVSLTPVGPDLGIVYNVMVSVRSPSDLRERVKGKPLPPSDGSHLSRLNIWEIVDIVESKSAIEECVYEAEDGRSYTILLEIEPTIVARTLEYRDQAGNPLYHVRWSSRVITRLRGK